MTKINVIMKSGNVIEIECETFNVTRDMATNIVKTLHWEKATPQIMYINLNEIAAVVELTGDARKQPVR